MARSPRAEFEARPIEGGVPPAHDSRRKDYLTIAKQVLSDAKGQELTCSNKKVARKIYNGMVRAKDHLGPRGDHLVLSMRVTDDGYSVFVVYEPDP